MNAAARRDRQRLECLLQKFLTTASVDDGRRILSILELWEQGIESPAPTYDPLRAHRVPDDHQKQLYWDTMRIILDGLKGRPWALQPVAQFVDLSANDRGCDTPAERFICAMIREHYHGGGLTPATVSEYLDPEDGEFARDFDNFQRSLARHRAMYPEPQSSQ
jgi:hypothetical protein